MMLRCAVAFDISPCTGHATDAAADASRHYAISHDTLFHDGC